MFLRKKRLPVRLYKNTAPPPGMPRNVTNQTIAESKNRVVSKPMVKILYSESDHPVLQRGQILSFEKANRLFEHRDSYCKEVPTTEHVVYEVSYLMNGEVCTCLEYQHLGDGEGSVINHLRINALNTLKTLEMVNVPGQAGDARSPFSIMCTSCESFLSVVLPQLEQLCCAPVEDREVGDFLCKRKELQ